MKSFSVTIGVNLCTVGPHFHFCCFRCCTKLSLSTKLLHVFRQMTAFEQYFLVVVSMMMYKVVLTLESVDEIQSVTNQMNAIEEKLIFLWH